MFNGCISKKNKTKQKQTDGHVGQHLIFVGGGK